MSTLTVRCVISVKWTNLDVQNPPSMECTLAVQQEANTQIPASVRTAWAESTITVQDNGTIPLAALMDYAQGKIDGLNAERTVHDPEAPVFGIAGDGPASCHYTWVEGERYCAYIMNLKLGGGPWEILDPTGQTSNPKLDMGLEWSLTEA